MMKKLIKIFGVIFVLFVGIALVLPLVVKVDQYRPQIVEAANQKLNGQLELGKLSLSLWGQIRIQVAGVKLSDTQGQEVVSVQDAYFHLPFLSILSGSPQLTFKMKTPTVNILKGRNGKLNVMSLMKEGATQPPSPGQPSAGTPAGAEPKNSTQLPGIVARARLGIEVKDAQVSYVDALSGMKTQVKDLNLILQDISLSHPTDLELWADLDTQVGKTFQLKGPAKLVGKASPEIKNGKLERVGLTARLDLDALEMKSPGMFEKKKGMATSVDLAITASPQEAKIENFLLKFFNLEVKVQGLLSQLDATGEGQSPVVNVKVESNEIQFKPWVELVPMLKEYELGGSARLNAQVSGPTKKLGYSGKLILTGLTAKAPQLKVQPRIDATISLITDELDQILMTMKAPGNDLKIQGKLVSFTQPHLSLDVTSSEMDLDQLIVFPPPAQKGQKDQKNLPAGAQVSSGGSSNPAPNGVKATPTDLDAQLNPLRENPIMREFVANIGVKMNRVKAQDIQISDILCRLSMKDLAAGWDQCGLKVFSGSIQSDARFQLKPKTPTYQMKLKVASLDISKAVQSKLALFKDTLTGIAHFNMTADGASFNSDPAISALKAHGNLKVDQAQFATVDVAKMVKEALDKTVSQIAEKVPALKGKSLPVQLPAGGSKYEFISSDFTIQNGKFSAPNFYAKASPNAGIDLKGNTVVGIKDYSLNTSWDVIDTYNLTHARDLSVDVGGTKVEHILAEGNSPVHFVVKAGCTITAPCYSYTEVPEALSKVALANVSHALTGRAQGEVKKQAEELIKRVAPPALQDKLKDQLKGFFH